MLKILAEKSRLASNLEIYAANFFTEKVGDLRRLLRCKSKKNELLERSPLLGKGLESCQRPALSTNEADAKVIEENYQLTTMKTKGAEGVKLRKIFKKMADIKSQLEN
jgi:hypothetical protein